MSTEQTGSAPAPKRVRVDGRSATARRFSKLVAAFRADLGDNPTAAQLELIQQAATLVVRASELQRAVIGGEPVDDDALVRLTNSAVRALSALGIQRKRNAAAPNLRDYIKSKSQ